MVVRTHKVTLAYLFIELAIRCRRHVGDLTLFVVEMVKVKDGGILWRDLESTILAFATCQFGSEKSLPAWYEVCLLEASLAISRVLCFIEVCRVCRGTFFTDLHLV